MFKNSTILLNNYYLWWAGEDLNILRIGLQPTTLPTELPARINSDKIFCNKCGYEFYTTSPIHGWQGLSDRFLPSCFSRHILGITI